MNKDRIMAYIDNQSEIKKCVETQFPFFIAHEYHRFYELLEKGQLFGAFFEMKRCAGSPSSSRYLLVRLISKAKGSRRKRKRCLETLIAHPLSLGQWAAYGNDLRKILQKDEAAKPLYQVLRSILQLYNRTGVVNWRNTRIRSRCCGRRYYAVRRRFQKVFDSHQQTLHGNGKFLYRIEHHAGWKKAERVFAP